MTQVLEFKLDEIFEGAFVPMWLRRFEADPAPALDDLLVGRAALGALDADEPSSVLIDWLEGLGRPFAKAVDAALSEWINRAWGEWQLPQANRSASVTSVAWCRVCDVIAMTEALDQSAAQLREKVLGDRRFLEGLHEGRSRDPAGRAWLALARHQPDRQLIDEWWRLCSLPPDEAWYRGAYGIHGLRGLPASDGESGGFRTEVAEGLALLGSSLARRAKLGCPPADAAKAEFIRTSRLTMAAYPYPKVWREFWTTKAPQSDNPPPQDWIKAWQGASASAVRSPSGGTARRASDRWSRPNRDWVNRARQIATAFRRHDLSVLEDAHSLLKEENLYAERTGDRHPATLTACSLASAIRRIRPAVALEWFELARSLEPWNPHGWTGTVTALVSANRTMEALLFAVQTVARFPDNVVARTGLGEVLKAQKQYADAEAVFRETVARFPDNVVARTSLGEVLKAQKKYADAEAVFRETVARFPDNVVARTGLGEVLKTQKQYAEAEDVFCETVARFPDNVVARNALGEVLKAQKKYAEAEVVFCETVARFPDNVVARSGLGEVLKAQKKYAEAEDVFRETVARFPDDVYALVGLAGVLMFVEPPNRGEALKLLEHAALLAPNDELVLQRLEGLRETDSLPEDEVDIAPATELNEDAQWDVAESSESSSIATSVESHAVRRSETSSNRLPQVGQSFAVEIPSEARILLTDSYLLRRWSRLRSDAGTEVQGHIQQKGKELLARLQPLWQSNVQVATESGLLAIAEGDLAAALKLLREAVKRFPGSSWVRYGLARAERELAQAEQRRLSDEAER